MWTKPKSLVFHLAAFAAVILIPAAAYMCYMLNSYIGEEQQELRLFRQAANDQAVNEVEKLIGDSLALIRSIATSPALDNEPNVDRFQQQVVALSPSAAILLLDAKTLSILARVDGKDGEGNVFDRETLNSLLNGGTETSDGILVSGLVHPERGKDALLAVTAPVRGDGKGAYLVMAVLPSTDLALRMIRTVGSAPFYASLIDANGRIIARSDPDEQKTGQLMPGFDFIKSGGEEWEGMNPQGIPVFGTFRRSDVTGWYVSLGMSREALEAPLWRSVQIIVVIAGLVLVGIALGVYAMGAPFRRTCGSLIKAVDALAQGQRISFTTLPIIEGNRIAQALVDASERLAVSHRLLIDSNETLERRVVERTEELAIALSKAEMAEFAAREASTELARLATTDSLTGLANRRMFNDAFDEAWLAARTVNEPLTLLVVDVDHFKSCNDTFGHAVGDDLLRSIGHCLQLGLRYPGDRLFRIGGEEFAILLINTNEDNAHAVAERLHATMTGAGVPGAGIHTGQTTISIGLAMSVLNAEKDPADLFRRADAALYEAKRMGRNRTVIAEAEPFGGQMMQLIRA